MSANEVTAEMLTIFMTERGALATIVMKSFQFPPQDGGLCNGE